ncbi:DUF1801 domain-containing protein [Patescibacteria group bacterium]|nr:MAG: DUF1801 domain-containing protein [Patescibacteria group bacterium]
MGVVADYLKDLPEPQQTELRRVQAIIVKTAPEAEEVITYGMPGYKYKKKYLVSFAAFKDHMSLFPGAMPVEELADELQEHKTSKGTVQFTVEKPLSEDLITKLVGLSRDRIDGKLR